MTYYVLEYFVDSKDHGHIYRTGDTYPRAGYKPSAERIQELFTSANKRGRAMIADNTPTRPAATVEEPVKTPKPRGRKKNVE